MEGNQQKMREALKYIVSLLRSDTFVVLNPPAMEIIAKILLASEAALSAPPRQCDVGTAENQLERWMEFCGRFDEDCTGCPLDDEACVSCTDCFARWEQMPYAAEEGAADENSK